MFSLDELKQIQEKYSNLGVNFSIIYIAEAHSKDKWPIGNKSKAQVTSSLLVQDRLQRAQSLQAEKNWNGNVFVDSMDDGMVEDMAGWPLRYWIVKGKRLSFIGVPNFAAFDFKELEVHLDYLLEI